MRETSCLKTKGIAPKSFVFLCLFVLASLYSMAQPTPGGVPATNLKLWFKADVGTNTTTDGAAVTSWVDNAGSATTVTDGPSVAKPTYIANGTNYNPSIFYPGGAYHVFGGSGTVSILNSMVFLAGTPVEATSTTGFHDPFVDFDQTEYVLNVNDGSFGHYGTGPFYQLPWAYDEPAFVSSQIYNVSGDVIITKGGGAPQTLTGAANPSGTSNYYYIGGSPDENSFGYISEAVIFDDADVFTLSPTDLQKINSYFSMKYGVINQDPDANNFLLSDGTMVWGTSSDFSQNILTIVNDPGSGLLQKQAHTTSDSTRLFVGSLAATNSANGGTITNDLSAVVIANNTAPVAMTTELDVAAPVLSRFQKTWAIQTTNFADNFSIAIQWDSATKFDMTAFRLLFSTDPALPSGSSTTIAPTFTASPNYITISGLSSADFTPGTVWYFSVGSTTLSTLPVAMTFSAAVTPDSKVALNWQTTSEINNNFFTLERSVDAQSWEAITKVSGAINSSTVKNYSYVDKNPYTGISYYRIKQTDLDGKYSYSKVKTVKVDKNGSGILTMYPNPVSGTLYIKGAATELATLRIFNMTGVDVTTLVKVMETTSAGKVLDVSRLSAGNYNIKTATAVTKLIKQ